MALCLPRRRRAISEARRPRTLSVASTTYQSRLTSCGLAENVLMCVSFDSSRTRSRPKFGKPEILHAEGERCQTLQVFSGEKAKKTQLDELRQVHTKGGGWRRQTRDCVGSAAREPFASPTQSVRFGLWARSLCVARRMSLPPKELIDLLISIAYEAVSLCFQRI